MRELYLSLVAERAGVEKRVLEQEAQYAAGAARVHSRAEAPAPAPAASSRRAKLGPERQLIRAHDLPARSVAIGLAPRCARDAGKRCHP